MPIVIPASIAPLTPMEAEFNRRLSRFIDFFFSVITGMALLQFTQSPFSKNLENAVTLPTAIHTLGEYYSVLLLFLFSFFFLVSDWVFYQELIWRLPYKLPVGILRFGFDVAAFSVLYFVLYLSCHASTVHTALWLVAILASWHLLIAVWHFIASRKETYTTGLGDHPIRFFSYVGVFLIGAETHQLAVLTVLTVVLITYFNGSRLYYFLRSSSDKQVPSAPTWVKGIDISILIGLWLAAASLRVVCFE